MGKNKNNQPIWNTRIKKEKTNLFKKVGGSIEIDKRLFREDIEASIVHVEMLFRQKIINFKIKNKIVWGLNRIKNEIIKKIEKEKETATCELSAAENFLKSKEFRFFSISKSQFFFVPLILDFNAK